MSNNENTKYYVYAYLDPRKSGKYIYENYTFDFEPFYIGKGSKRRARNHLDNCMLNNNDNKMKSNKIKKILKEGYDLQPIIIKNNLSESDAFELEKLLIKIIGRKDLKLGPLTNLSNGGEGQSGFHHSEETKKLISEKGKGKKHTQESKDKISKNNSMNKQEHRDKVSEAVSGENNPRFGKPGTFKGKHHKDETKKLLSEINKGQKNPKYIYILSNNEDFFTFFTKQEKKNICKRLQANKEQKTIYNGITIQRFLRT